MLIQLRPQMVSLVELVDDESYLKSATGNPHGEIFETLLDFAKSSELNNKQLPDYYEQYMKPLILANDDGGKCKL